MRSEAESLHTYYIAMQISRSTESELDGVRKSVRRRKRVPTGVDTRLITPYTVIFGPDTSDS